MKLKILTIALILTLFGCTNPDRPPKPIPRELLGECDRYSCGELFVELQSNFPETVSKYDRECVLPQVLGLFVYDHKEGEKRVNFACWSELSAEGSRNGYFLGTLPFPGYENSFSSEWNCSGNDCETIIKQVRDRHPEATKKAEFECATNNGNLFFFAPENPDEIEVECQFFAYTLWDENGDGITDGDRGTSVSYPIATFKLDS